MSPITMHARWLDSTQPQAALSLHHDEPGAVLVLRWSGSVTRETFAELLTHLGHAVRALDFSAIVHDVRAASFHMEPATMVATAASGALAHLLERPAAYFINEADVSLHFEQLASRHALAARVRAVFTSERDALAWARQFGRVYRLEQGS